MRKLIFLMCLFVCLISGCSSKDIQIRETLNLIQQTEDIYVETGIFIDKHKEDLYNFLTEKDINLIKDFCSEKVLDKLSAVNLTNFVIVKQEYMTAIGHGNITHYLIIRSQEGLSILYLYWNSTQLYDVDIGEMRNEG